MRILVFLFVFLAFVHGAKYIEYKKQDLVPLITEKPTFLFLSSSTCGHCSSFDSTFDRLAETVDSIQFVKITCELHKDECDMFQVKEYPTLKFVKTGGRVYEYTKDRNEFKIKDWLKGEYASDPSKPLEGFETWMEFITNFVGKWYHILSVETMILYWERPYLIYGSIVLGLSMGVGLSYLVINKR
jgi:thiol-disulfide isomerase/thioredoxin